MRAWRSESAAFPDIVAPAIGGAGYVEALPAHPAIPVEPARDWSLGWLTGHRTRMVMYLALTIAGLYALQAWLWPSDAEPRGWAEQLWTWTSLLWIGPALSAFGGLAGLLMFRHSRSLDQAEPIPQLVAFRIVSRGFNVEVLTSTVRRCQAEMAKTPLFPYVIEIVTDGSRVKIPAPNKDVRYITVPPRFHTPNGTLFKARALEYASQHSKLPRDAWIVHLDEETQPTASGIKGICAMIRAEEASGRLRIGQGPILYHRTWKEHPFLTLADNIRTGYDFAHFHFQHRIGLTLYGMHGSYIVVRNDIERSIGFDVGPEGSITEDAFWALLAMERGYRCVWVDGYLEEQSTQSVKDFVKQRRRWFQGLVKVSLYTPVSWRWRLPIGYNTLVTAVTPFAMIYTVTHLFYGFSSEPWIIALANVSFATYLVVYLAGLTANLDEHGITHPFKRAGWSLAQVLLLPAFNFIEGLGVLAAIFRPRPGFYVVKK